MAISSVECTTGVPVIGAEGEAEGNPAKRVERARERLVNSPADKEFLAPAGMPCFHRQGKNDRGEQQCTCLRGMAGLQGHQAGEDKSRQPLRSRGRYRGENYSVPVYCGDVAGVLGGGRIQVAVHRRIVKSFNDGGSASTVKHHATV